MSKYDVIVIGGGLTGTAIALGCQRHKARVAIVDEGDIAHRASRSNFGLIWLQGKGLASKAYLKINTHAIQSWPSFAQRLTEQTGIDTGWRQPGGFHFCFTPQEVEKRKKLLANAAAWNKPDDARFIERDELEKLIPEIGREVLGASYSALDAEANPLYLLRASHQAFIQQGGSYHPGAPADRIEPTASGFTVYCGSEKYHADKIVIAAGLGGKLLAEQVHIDLPIAPQRGQILVTERMTPFFPYVSNCVRQTAEGTILLGSTQEQSCLNDKTETTKIRALLHNGLRVFPHLENTRVVRIWAGLRILTPDGLPVYEQSKSFPNAFVVTCHSGLTLMSFHEEFIARAIIEGVLPSELKSFKTKRFHV